MWRTPSWPASWSISSRPGPSGYGRNIGDLHRRKERGSCAGWRSSPAFFGAILHPNLNTPFLREGTLLSVNKLEVQANKFAVDLMYSDSDLQEALNWTVEQTATWMGVPQRYAEYRILSVEPRLLPETP